MTSCINIAKKANISYTIHQYSHDQSTKSYGNEAISKLAVPKEKVFKTLVVNISEKELAVAVVPVLSKLSMKLIAKAVGVKKAKMAKKLDVEKSTGYILGGVSPIGQKKILKTVIDSQAKEYETIFVSAGRRGLEIELKAEDLRSLTNGIFWEICQ